MNWFETASIASLAKNAIKEAQKTIDKALDIKNEEATDVHGKMKGDSEEFFPEFGITVNSESDLLKDDESKSETSVVNSIWGSFTGSFFENTSSKSSSKGRQPSVDIKYDASNSIIATQPPKNVAHPSLCVEERGTSGDTVKEGKSRDNVPPQQELAEESLSTDENEEAASWKKSGANIPPDHKLSTKELVEIISEETLDDDFPDGRFSTAQLVVCNFDDRVSTDSAVDSYNVEAHSSTPETSKYEEISSPSADLGRPNLGPDSLNVDSAVSEQQEYLHENPANCDNFVLKSPSSMATSSSIQVLSGESSSISSPEQYKTGGFISNPENSMNFSSSSDIASVSQSSSHADSLKTNVTESSPEEAKHDTDTITQQPVLNIHDQICPQLTLASLNDEIRNLVQGNDDGDEISSGLDLSGNQTSFNNNSSSEHSRDRALSINFDRFIQPLAADFNRLSDAVFNSGISKDFVVSSLSAGEIRKNLDNVDKLATQDSRSSVPAAIVKNDLVESGDSFKEMECSQRTLEISTSSMAPLDASCRSVSSTETVTGSEEFQQMDWYQLRDCSDNAQANDEFDDNSQTEHVFRRAKTDADSVRDTNKLRLNLPKENDDKIDLLLPVLGTVSANSSQRSGSMKVSSNHSSADELETANSSDIEIISSPSMDGSINGSGRKFLAPVNAGSKFVASCSKGLKGSSQDSMDALSKKDSSNGNQVETIPSSMTTSFTSASESDADHFHVMSAESLQLDSPPRLPQSLLTESALFGKGHKRSKSCHSEKSDNSFVEIHSPETEKLVKRINQLTEIIEIREAKVFELSRSNAALVESNAALTSRMKEVEVPGESSEGVREEFTQRLVNIERKFQQALKEKELMKKELEEYTSERASKGFSVDIRRELEDKEAIIQELRTEGEKLSKMQLNYTNHIKKLKAKEKDNDATISNQKQKIDSQRSEIERLQKQCKAKEEIERSQIDAIRQLTSSGKKNDEELSVALVENAELDAKIRALKEALDTAYREISELREGITSKEDQAREMALSWDLTSKQQLEAAVGESEEKIRLQRETLLAQVNEAQDALARSEQQSNGRERALKEEIRVLQERLSASESRVDQLSDSVSAATKPLLRQLDNLQASHDAQRNSWDGLENALTRKIQELQSSATASSKKEREAKEHASSLLTEMAFLQNQVSALQKEKDECESEKLNLSDKVSKLNEEKSKESDRLSALRQSFADETSELRRERDVFEQKLQMERTAIAAEKRKTATCQDQIKEKERKIAQLQNQLQSASVHNSRLSSPRSSPTPSLSRISASGSVAESNWPDDVFDGSGSVMNRSSSTVYDVIRGSNASTLDTLASALRSKEGEVHHLQSEVIRAESQKAALSEALVEASAAAEERDALSLRLTGAEASWNDLQQKYNALLQMYGEKVEEVEELRLDLSDVKEMYKNQIDHLLQK